VDELISFEVQSASTISSVSWTFGNGNSSNQLKPSIVYSSPGSYTVEFTANLSGGGSCSGSKDITVHGLPKAQFSFADSSDYCLNQNKVCLIDESTPYNSNTITKAQILWDDGGKNNISNPTKGQVTCYTYQTVDDYTIQIEIEDNKGCKDKTELKHSILKDFKVNLRYTVNSKDCDEWEVTFINDSSLSRHSTLADTAYWDPGDGSGLIGGFKEATHSYTSNGTFTVKFFVKLKNGCLMEREIKVKIDLFDPKFDFSVSPKRQCYPKPFSIVDQVTGKSDYTWLVYDVNMDRVGVFYGRQTYISAISPGKYYIQGRSMEDECEVFSALDSFESVGVQTSYLPLNGIQCAPKDTVFFFNTSIVYGTDSVDWFWNFGDTANSASCRNTPSFFSNCNYSINQFAKHWYDSTDCYPTSLVARDRENQCIDSTNELVSIQDIDDIEFFYRTKRACIGLNPDYGMEFYHNACRVFLQINYDSACGKDKWIEANENDTLFNYLYPTICDTSGWVTVGFIPQSGDSIVYLSNDTSDYTVLSNRYCIDTIWKHRWFKLQRNPTSYAEFQRTNCLPVEASVVLRDREQSNVRLVSASWGDGTTDSIFIGQSDTIPKMEHTYTEPGDYFPRITVETDSGCMSSNSTRMTLGYQNDFIIDSVICPGAEVLFYDTLRYFSDPERYWRDPVRIQQGKETLKWDFDDGNGFATDGPLPLHTFDTVGTYTVRMASKDQNGCRDTVTKIIRVANVVAGIKAIDKKLVCSDVIQLIDSSYTPFADVGDEITGYFWGFGDGKTPSLLENPFHFYEQPGTYQIIHVVNNTKGCSDTARTTITIAGPLPEFEIVSDTVGCVPFTAEFNNQSTECSDYLWYFGDAAGSTLSTQSDTNVSFTYTQPGIYPVYLLGSDSVINPDNGSRYFCSGLFPDSSKVNPPVRRIIVLPIPEAKTIADSVVCVDEEAVLSDQSDSLYTTYRWFLNSDSIISNDSAENYTFSDSGSYQVVYKPLYTPTGPYQRACFDTDTINIEVKQLVTDLIVSPNEPCDPIDFKVTGNRSISPEWSFNHPVEPFTSGALEESQSFLQDTGYFNVCVRSTDIYGCMDIACDSVYNDVFYYLFIPNIITPNEDGLNDYYDINVIGENGYQLTIFNRWGEEVFSSNRDSDQEVGNFTGTSMEGMELPSGTYFYLLKVLPPCEDEWEEINGTITIVR
jgi:gliding motility-associated-like protein